MVRWETKQSGISNMWSSLAIDGAVIAEDIEWRVPWTAEWGHDYNVEGVSVYYDTDKMEVRGFSADGDELYLPMPDWVKSAILTYETRGNRDRIRERIEDIAHDTRSRL